VGLPPRPELVIKNPVKDFHDHSAIVQGHSDVSLFFLCARLDASAGTGKYRVGKNSSQSRPYGVECAMSPPDAELSQYFIRDMSMDGSAKPFPLPLGVGMA